MLIRVDLPQPLGPKIETMSPLDIFRLKSIYKGNPEKDLFKLSIKTCVLRGLVKGFEAKLEVGLEVGA